MERRIFMYEDNGDYEQHRVYKVGYVESSRLITEGKGTEVMFREYDAFRNQARKLADSYKRAETKVKTSDNPLHTDDYKNYELRKLKRKFEEDTQAVEDEYQKYRENEIEEARQKSAQATIRVTQSDKQLAEQLANRLDLEAQAAISDAQKANFIDQAKESIGRLTDEQRTALQGVIGKVLVHLDQRQKRMLINKVSDIRNMDVLGAKVAEQLPPKVSIEYDQLRLIRRWS